MTGVPTVVYRAIDVGLAAAFVGLAVLGLVLIGLAVSLDASLLERVVTLILGAGGLLIGAGYFASIARHKVGAGGGQAG